jgi:hypothetical protein
MSLYINVIEDGKLIKRIAFINHNRRILYLIRERNQARFKKHQYSYKRGEYLRIYRNAVLFKEYDIKNVRQDPRAELDKLFA